jgi:D-alanyl-D-alanine carboxypeptidase
MSSYLAIPSTIGNLVTPGTARIVSRRLLYCVAVYALCCTPAHADKIDRLLKAEIQRQHIPGLSIAVVQNGKIIKEKAYGLANVEHQVAATPATIFQSGSIGKQFTAALVMLLVADGKLNLDASIEQYLPDSPAAWKKITLRHLLTHTSGLPDPYDKLDLQKEYTDTELLKIESTLPLLFQPGEQWAYSNTAYHLLGFICTKVGGKFYGEQLRERLFKPAGMQTRIISERDIVPQRAAGYDLVQAELKNQEWVSPSMNTTADGSLYLTAHDMALWDLALYRNSPLSAAIKQQSWTPVTLNNGQSHPYGFGWEVDSVNQHRVLRHDGAWQGFTTYISRYVDDKFSVIVLSNRSEANVARIAKLIVAHYRPDLVAAAAKAIPDVEPQITQQVRALLLQYADGSLPEVSFTEKARALMFPKAAQENGAEIALYGKLTGLQLLARKVDGEDRNYRYRALYSKETVLVDIHFNKGGKVDYLQIIPE